MTAAGSKRLRIDNDAVARAEAALAAMSVNFEDWLQAEITRLNNAMSSVHAEGRSETSMEALYHRTHDLKGLGATYGYPIISQISGTLCRLIDSAEKRLTSPLPLIEVHVEAIKAAARNKITTDEDAIGRALVKELDGKVAAFDRDA
jgi:chemotaxis protein histidine kinase CheA